MSYYKNRINLNFENSYRKYNFFVIYNTLTFHHNKIINSSFYIIKNWNIAVMLFLKSKKGHIILLSHIASL